MTERTVTLATIDHGDVTIPCPEWCQGHDGHRPEVLSDIAHSGPDVVLKFRGRHITEACLDQSPLAEIVSREPGVSVSAIGMKLDPTGLYELAATLDSYADQLRELADQLARILDGGER